MESSKPRQFAFGDVGTNKRILDYAQANVYPQIDNRRELVERILIDWENDRLHNSKRVKLEVLVQRVDLLTRVLVKVAEKLNIEAADLLME